MRIKIPCHKTGSGRGNVQVQELTKAVATSWNMVVKVNEAKREVWGRDINAKQKVELGNRGN